MFNQTKQGLVDNKATIEIIRYFPYATDPLERMLGVIVPSMKQQWGNTLLARAMLNFAHKDYMVTLNVLTTVKALKCCN